MSQIHVIAPVPAVHMKSAFETAETQGKVAFGTDAWEAWDGLAGKDVMVWIYTTQTGAPKDWANHEDFTPIGKIVAHGSLSGVTIATARGQHQSPERRPASALETDGAWSLFWEVEHLERLPQPLSKAGLKLASKKNVPDVIHRVLALHSPPSPSEGSTP